LARGVPLLPPRIRRHAVELRLEVRDLRGQRILALHQPLLALAAGAGLAGGGQVLHVGGDPLLLVLQLLRALLRLADVAIEPPLALALEQPPRLLQAVERGLALGARAALGVRGRAA